MLRRCIVCLALGFFGSLPLSALEILHVRYGWYEEGEFQHISEFFGAEEYDPRRVIVRTTPEVRTGNYFVVIVDTERHAFPESAEIVLDVVTAEKTEPERFRFALPTKSRGAKEIFVGFTGEQEIAGRTKVLAWRTAITDGRGNELAFQESFLWKAP